MFMHHHKLLIRFAQLGLLATLNAHFLIDNTIIKFASNMFYLNLKSNLESLLIMVVLEGPGYGLADFK